MRRRLTILVLAVTSFVVVSYTIPLALLVDRQAEQAAMASAERLVQQIGAQLVEVVATNGSGELNVIASELAIPAGVAIVDELGRVVGDETVVTDAGETAIATRETAADFEQDGDWALALPVLTLDGPLAIQTVVPAAVLDRGVARATGFLVLLGVVLIVASLVMADRLGQTLRRPVRDIALAAERLGRGDLDTRVAEPDIPELRVVADALNTLAPRLRNLLVQEREAMADLSHRLRTPLAALRLQSGALSLPGERDAMHRLVDRMESSVDGLIGEMRTIDEPPTADLGVVARRHASFWEVLAEEQGREFDIDITDEPLVVAAAASELGDAIDVLIGNVFDHTPEGTSFGISVRRDPGWAILSIEDAGPGLPDRLDVFGRGVSGTGSTGLGLDIVRKLSERTSGSVRSIDGAGARIELRLPLI